MKVLVLSPYDAASHRRWRTGIEAHFPDFEFTQIALPARHFNWRLRGNSLSLAFSDDARLAGPYDLLLATSMTDLSALRGMRPELARIPAIVYFHENQFAYPAAPDRPGWLEARVLNLYTALAADQVVFNSRYNRDTFLAGAAQLLAGFPDHVPAGIVERISGKSSMLPVPLEDACFVAARKSAQFTIVWNHRWEYDKGPERLLAIVNGLSERKADFRMHLLGQRFRSVPAEMEEAIARLRDCGSLGECGFVEEIGRYRTLLAGSHLVLSTALHEFQGLAVLEAMAAGCSALVPDRLVYPEYVPDAWRYGGADAAAEAQRAVDAIVTLGARVARGEPLPPPDVEAYSWRSLAPAWRDLFERTAMLRSGHE